jgi:hypothetical protein
VLVKVSWQQNASAPAKRDNGNAYALETETRFEFFMRFLRKNCDFAWEGCFHGELETWGHSNTYLLENRVRVGLCSTTTADRVTSNGHREQQSWKHYVCAVFLLQTASRTLYTSSQQRRVGKRALAASAALAHRRAVIYGAHFLMPPNYCSLCALCC